MLISCNYKLDEDKANLYHCIQDYVNKPQSKEV